MTDPPPNQPPVASFTASAHVPRRVVQRRGGSQRRSTGRSRRTRGTSPTRTIRRRVRRDTPHTTPQTGHLLGDAHRDRQHRRHGHGHARPDRRHEPAAAFAFGHVQSHRGERARYRRCRWRLDACRVRRRASRSQRQSGRIAGAVSGNRAGYLQSVAQTNVDMTTDVALDTASTGGGAYVSLIGRRVSNNNDYRLKLRYLAGGSVVAYLTRTVGGTETVLASTTVPGPDGQPRRRAAGPVRRSAVRRPRRSGPRCGARARPSRRRGC